VLKAEKRAAIAIDLQISIWTVDFHIINIKRKIGAHSVIEVAIFFARNPAILRS